MRPLAIRVQGIPGTQGSKDPVGTTKDGRVIMKESSDKHKPWRTDVKEAAEKAFAEAGMTEVYDCPLALVATFYFWRPKSHYLPVNKKRTTPELRSTAPPYPSGLPDLDKLVRAIGDALTAAGVWRDDARVVRIVADKAYICPEVDSPRPGAIIRVVPMVDTPAVL